MIPINEIESFIKNLAKLSYQNPNLQITDDLIYSQLRCYGLSENEKNNSDILEQTNKLEQAFAKAKNISAFYTPLQKGFLQMRSKKSTRNDGKCVKMYINVPKEYVGFASYKIFDFIDKHNFETHSKVACKVRSDCIVMRIFDPKAARQVIDFINNDKELKKIARPTNPFSIKNGLVGIGYDDMLSYNSTISKLLSKYINDLKNNNLLGLASMEGLQSFLVKYHQDTFVNCSKLHELINDPDFIKYNQSGRFDHNPGRQVVNLEQIVRLFGSTITNAVNRKNKKNRLFNDNYDKEDIDFFFQFFNDCLNEKQNEQNITFYNQAVDKIWNPVQTVVQPEPVVSNVSNPKKDIDDVIAFLTAKYGTPNITVEYLQKYFNGYDNAITRDGGCRWKILAIGRDNVRQIIGNDIYNYVNNALNQQLRQPQSIPTASLDGYKKFCEVSEGVLRTNGVVQLIVGLKTAMSGNYIYLPGGESLREIIRPSSIKQYCLIYLQSIGYDVNNSKDIIVDFATEYDKAIRPLNKTQQY